MNAAAPSSSASIPASHSERPVVAITGASSGVGAALAALHAREGWDVIMINRSVTRSAEAVQRIHDESPDAAVEVVEADLADLDSITAAADTLRERGHIDLFYNNAGVLVGTPTSTPHGVELSAQVHIVAPYLLTRLLHRSLVGSTVVTVVTGGVMQAKPLVASELSAPPTFARLIGPYTQTKLGATALMAAFAREYPGTTFRSVEPGAVKTPMTRGEGMPPWLKPIRNLFFSSPEKAALRVYEDATNPLFASANGALVLNRKLKTLPHNSGDPEVQAELLAWCTAITGV
jgi:NAD(P)-dependent dehydrogenase (short-subunit alcohol dehydrogenase family)